MHSGVWTRDTNAWSRTAHRRSCKLRPAGDCCEGVSMPKIVVAREKHHRDLLHRLHTRESSAMLRLATDDALGVESGCGSGA